jgi:hypothetical protein
MSCRVEAVKQHDLSKEETVEREAARKMTEQAA